MRLLKELLLRFVSFFNYFFIPFVDSRERSSCPLSIVSDSQCVQSVKMVNECLVWRETCDASNDRQRESVSR